MLWAEQEDSVSSPSEDPTTTKEMETQAYELVLQRITNYYSPYRLWHRCIAECNLEDSYSPTHGNIYSDLFHDDRNLFCP
jgi:hypothetical protein